ncbi:MAG: hypothetical protein PHE88_01275 [Elusimicrobia bacterium]|nr:hypothetical protein [Elusimicrobiota bacterium]
MIIDAKNLTHRQLNEKIRENVKKGTKKIVLKNINGQRYIASGLKSDVEIKIYGTAGNDLGSFMSGPKISVYGNAQDCIANTMDTGKIAIHGSVGDILSYGMRGGKVFVRDNAGYRAGIHMKSYKEMVPLIVIGGCVCDFFAEYMAGGIIILLGLDKSKEIAGNFVGTGMHGGTIYVRGNIKKNQLGREVDIVKYDKNDEAIIKKYLAEFCGEFKLDYRKYSNQKFTKLKALHTRPYGKIYTY